MGSDLKDLFGGIYDAVNCVASAICLTRGNYNIADIDRSAFNKRYNPVELTQEEFDRYKRIKENYRGMGL